MKRTYFINSILTITTFLFLPSYCNASDAIIAFKNEDGESSVPIVSTMSPYLDNFSWASLRRSDYQATWHFLNRPSTTKSFKDVNKITLASGECILANLSSPWEWNWYGMSQYAFNYENRQREYGCFITELRLNARWLESWFEGRDYNIVIASYRYDPSHPTDYLTCYVKRNSPYSFTVHMVSSQNKKEEDNEDSKRYSIAGDTEKLRRLNDYKIDLPIELWKDEKNNLVFEMVNNQTVPVIKSRLLQAADSSPNNTADSSSNHISTIELINNTSQVLVAGQPLLDKFSRLNSQYLVMQPQQLQPASVTKEESTIKLSIFPYHLFAFVRLNYHFADYAEDSGCYITTYVQPFSSLFWTIYRFDPKHLGNTEKNLYCLITDGTGSTNKITITFYENPLDIKEPGINPVELNTSPYVSYSYSTYGNRDLPFYDQGKELIDKEQITKVFRKEDLVHYHNDIEFPIDPTHYFSFGEVYPS